MTAPRPPKRHCNASVAKSAGFVWRSDSFGPFGKQPVEIIGRPGQLIHGTETT